MNNQYRSTTKSTQVRAMLMSIQSYLEQVQQCFQHQENNLEPNAQIESALGALEKAMQKF